MQNHSSDISQVYASLPYLYSVIFSQKTNLLTTPLGGLIIKSNIPKNDQEFVKKIKEVSLTLEPATALVNKANTCQVVPIIEESPTLPTEIDCNRMATDAYTMVGIGGNA